MLRSVITGVILYLVTSTLTLGIIYMIGFFNEGVMNIINTTEIINPEAIKDVMMAGIGIYLLYNVIYYVIGKKQFEKCMKMVAYGKMFGYEEDVEFIQI